MRYVGDDVAIRQVGDSKIAYKPNNGNHPHGRDIEYCYAETLIVLQRATGEHHQRDDKQGNLLLQVEQGIVHVAGAYEPQQMDTQQDEKCLEEVVLTPVGKLLLPVPFDHPVD